MVETPVFHKTCWNRTGNLTVLTGEARWPSHERLLLQTALFEAALPLSCPLPCEDPRPKSGVSPSPWAFQPHWLTGGTNFCSLYITQPNSCIKSTKLGKNMISLWYEEKKLQNIIFNLQVVLKPLRTKFDCISKFLRDDLLSYLPNNTEPYNSIFSC